MARKLKKKYKKKVRSKIIDDAFEEAIEKRKKTGRSKRKMYKKQKCAFHDENGKRCTRNAVGKSTLCEKHGGTRVDVENTFNPEETRALVLSGKNTLFKAETHPIEYIQLSREGLSEVEIAAHMNISVATLRKWSETYQEFAIAFEVGQAMQEAWWLRKGKAGLDDRYFNTSLYKFLTGNKLGYSDKIETKSTNTHLHGVLVIPDTQTEEEWEANFVDGEFEEVEETKETPEGDK